MLDVAAARELSPHEQLQEAIEQMEDPVHALQSLIDEVRGSGSVEKVHEAPPRPNLSLVQVLSDGPNTIRDRNEQLLSMIAELRSTLL